jgi:carbamoyltransferase
MYTLGINAVYHDPAACLIRDGEVLAAAEEERFTHIKHGKRPVPFSTWELPFHAVEFCLRTAGIRLADVDHVAYSYDPYLLLGRRRNDATVTLPLKPAEQPRAMEWEAEWDPLFLMSIVNAPGQLVDGAPHHLRERFRGARTDSFRWHFVPHHLSHAASAFHASPFPEAAVMTLDGRGEKATTGYAREVKILRRRSRRLVERPCGQSGRQFSGGDQGRKSGRKRRRPGFLASGAHG